MKDRRMEQWQQHLKTMQSYHTTDEAIRAFGPPGQRVHERDREIWHFPLGVVEGLLYSIHAVTCKGALNEAYIHAMPAGTYVQQGTSEQIEQIRHRYWLLRVVWIAFIGSVFTIFLIPLVLGPHPSPAAVRLFRIGYFLCGGFALGIFSIVYWRCPVCKNEFSRQSRGGKYCEHCKTKFDD